MTQPTSSQLRALEMFRQMVDLPQDAHFTRASAVARCLTQEGVDVSAGWFHQLTLTDNSIVDVEVLEIDGALVDAQGIHPGWSAAALVYGGDAGGWRDSGATTFSHDDPGWLGVRGSVLLEQSVSALSSRVLQMNLAANTPEAATDRRTRRM